MITWDILKKYNFQYVYVRMPREKHIMEKYNSDQMNGLLKKNLDHIVQVIKKSTYYIKKNTYPYHLTKNIEHYVFWFYAIDISMEQCYIIATEHFKNNNIIVFCNAPAFKSVQSIEHYHIFVKNY